MGASEGVGDAARRKLDQADALHLFVAATRAMGYTDPRAALKLGRDEGWVKLHSLGDAIASSDRGLWATAMEAVAEGATDCAVMEFTQSFLDDIVPGAVLVGRDD